MLCKLWEEGIQVLLKQKSGDFTLSMVWLLYLLFSAPLLWGRFPVVVVAMVLSRTRCPLQSQNYVYGCIVKNYLFWQARLVYSELIQYHFSYSKVERGSSGHSPRVKANVSFSSAGKAWELALSFHFLVSCSDEQPLHALPSSWLALEGRSIWSSINVSFRIMRAREEGRGIREFKPTNQHCLLFHQALLSWAASLIVSHTGFPLRTALLTLWDIFAKVEFISVQKGICRSLPFVLLLSVLLSLTPTNINMMDAV